MRLKKEQSEEISRCAVDFSYFCEHYVKLNITGKDGTVPFKLYPYQVRLYEHLEDNRFTIFSKFRQGGFTTELAIYGLWKCLFRLDQRILWLSPTDREAIDVCDSIVKKVIENIPEWMRGNVMKMTNSHQKSFVETDSHMHFYNPKEACGRAMSLLIIDEASFIKDMDETWKALWPCVGVGANVVICSTANYDDDWFWSTLQNASLNLNNFSVYECDYLERPEFRDPQWELEARKNLGNRGWDVDYEQNAIERVQIEKPFVKPSKKLWRSIWDEWDDSSNLDQRSLESE